ncbi:MAG TPA: hypothetical protein VFK10_21000 [Burkholderiaceae bacterium]|nr:hypothetical protein [Burkholderiaceae bacterium]
MGAIVQRYMFDERALPEALTPASTRSTRRRLRTSGASRLDRRDLRSGVWSYQQDQGGFVCASAVIRRVKRREMGMVEKRMRSMPHTFATWQRKDSASRSTTCSHVQLNPFTAMSTSRTSSVKRTLTLSSLAPAAFVAD